MSVSSHLIGMTPAESQAKDELFTALTQIAQVVPHDKQGLPVVPPIKGNPNEASKNTQFASRFFFVPTASVYEQVEQQKKQLKTKKLKHVDDVIIERAHKLRAELPKSLKTQANKVREYFLKDLSSKMLAVQLGADQARYSLERYLGSEIEAAPFTQFEMMARAAVRIRHAEYLVKHFGLPKDAADALIEAVMPARPVFPLMGSSEPQRSAATTPIMSKPKKQRPDDSELDQAVQRYMHKLDKTDKQR